MLGVLQNRTYRHLFAAQLLALVGTGLLTVALGLLAYDLARADAGAVLGTALAIKMVAYVFISPTVAALADRLPRRVLLVTADLVRASIALMLPFVTEVWQIYVLIFLLQSASAAFTPTFQAVIPAVLPDEREYTRALSLSRLAYDLESLLSPVLAAALLTVVAYNSLFLGTVAGFVASALLVVSVRLPAPTPLSRDASVWSRMTLGVRVFGRTPVLRSLLGMNLVVAAATAMVLVNTVVVVRDALGRSNVDVAIALACYGAGSMVVALLLPRVLDRVPERRLMLSACAVLPAGLFTIAAVTAWAGGGTFSWVSMLIIWGVLGAATSCILTPSGRLLRRSSDDADRPSVFAAQFSLSHACFLLTYPIAGWVGASLGLSWSALVLAVVGSAAAIAAAYAWRERRGVEPELQAL